MPHLIITKSEVILLVSTAAEHRTGEPRRRARAQQREAHDPFKRGNNLAETRIERDEPVLGDEDAVAWQYLVIGVNGSLGT